MRPVARLFGIESLGATGGTLLTTGIFFFTSHRLGWGLAENFRLAIVQGLVYVAGSLLAAKLARWFGPGRALALSHGGMALVAAGGAVAAGAARAPVVPAVVASLLTYTFLSSTAWPILEGLVASGGEARALSTRVATYNLVWSGTMPVAMALSGLLIESRPAAVLVVPAVAHALAASVALAGGAAKAHDEQRTAGHPPAPPPEAELLRARTLALWVSRLALPATYCVIFGLMPMMPSLPVMKPLDAHTQTLVGSTWLAARWLTFVLLALGTWWHTRPRVLLAAAWLMFSAFLGMTLRPSLLWGATPVPGLDLAWMMACQALLGAAVGMIYSGSLYFGMVLSDGSTEHGGYHEALIGLGWVLGPIAGAAAGGARVGAAVAAIAVVVALSVLATCAAAVAARFRET